MDEFEIRKETWYKTVVTFYSDGDKTVYVATNLNAAQAEDFSKAAKAGVSVESLEALLSYYRNNGAKVITPARPQTTKTNSRTITHRSL